MKKIFLSVLLLAGFGLLYGQNLGGGLSLGANFSQIDGDNYAGYNRAGLSLGGFVRFQLSDRLVVQPEIAWDQLGSASKDVTFSNRFNYITVPLFFLFQIPISMGNQRTYLNLHAAPAVGILLKAVDSNVNPPVNDITEGFKSLDIKGIIGAEFQLSFRFSICARYAYSLAPFAKGTTLKFPTGPYHNYFQLSLRYFVSKR